MIPTSKSSSCTNMQICRRMRQDAREHGRTQCVRRSTDKRKRQYVEYRYDCRYAGEYRCKGGRDDLSSRRKAMETPGTRSIFSSSSSASSSRSPTNGSAQRMCMHMECMFRNNATLFAAKKGRALCAQAWADDNRVTSVIVSAYRRLSHVPKPNC